MNKLFFLLFLTIAFASLRGMNIDNFWPKDKPVPFNSLPVEHSSDDESEPRQTAMPKTSEQAPKHEPAATVPAPCWSNGGEPSPKIVAQYQQKSWKWGDSIEPLQEIVAQHAQKADKPYAPPAGSVKWRFFSGHDATANYDDTQKSCLVQQLLFKHLCVQVWDRLNPLMDDIGSKAWHDFMVKLKKQEINLAQNEVAITKKDLYHRLLPFVLTDGTQCQVNNKDMALTFKPNTQNGVEGELVSTEYDLQADKAHHEHVMATFGHILDMSSGMNEVWAANPHQ